MQQKEYPDKILKEILKIHQKISTSEEKKLPQENSEWLYSEQSPNVETYFPQLRSASACFFPS